MFKIEMLCNSIANVHFVVGNPARIFSPYTGPSADITTDDQRHAALSNSRARFQTLQVIAQQSLPNSL